MKKQRQLSGSAFSQKVSEDSVTDISCRARSLDQIVENTARGKWLKPSQLATASSVCQQAVTGVIFSDLPLPAPLF